VGEKGGACGGGGGKSRLITKAAALRIWRKKKKYPKKREKLFQFNSGGDKGKGVLLAERVMGQDTFTRKGGGGFLEKKREGETLPSGPGIQGRFGSLGWGTRGKGLEKEGGRRGRFYYVCLRRRKRPLTLRRKKGGDRTLFYRKKKGKTGKISHFGISRFNVGKGGGGDLCQFVRGKKKGGDEFAQTAKETRP